ncbi:hypothetical protein OG897_40560 [Streptomyces sp. NBC_00237]|uniref:hypothetical protein n=1 Tax=Streptomyces sp. NBC_00237 TaxID=2975687 RepID=UPI0022542B4A|nr:hypothetical protein [Streptomyces sp. NBC_00237]MCX5207677.1 hypothetical protein [Streptomyces sp. NBC_00237]
MILIICGACGGHRAKFGILADGKFQCAECRELLDPRDIDVDGEHIWAVGPDGTLGYVTDPVISIEEMDEALDDYMSAPHDSYGELESLRRMRDAASQLHDAYRAGIPFPHARIPEDRNTAGRVSRPAPSMPVYCPSCGGAGALHAAPDGTFVCSACDWYTDTDAIPHLLRGDDWAVYATGELGQIESQELGLEVPQESRLCCPKCRTGEATLTCRQWCYCTECGWGGMEYEALYFGDYEE